MYKHPWKARQKYYLQLEAILRKYFGKLFLRVIYMQTWEKENCLQINFYQLENLNVEWSGANSICENLTFRVKIRKYILNLFVSVHHVVREHS